MPEQVGEPGLRTDSVFWKRDLKKIRHLVGQTMHLYGLIKDGDNIMAAVSGGKDSLVMVKFLADLRRRVPVKFGLGAVHLGSGKNQALAPWLEGLGLDYVHWESAVVVEELENYHRGDPSPCFGCSRKRRNRLFELSRYYGATSLALGHHLDDAAETILMNMFFCGRLEGLSPRLDLFEGRLTLIRPLFAVPESLIVRLAQGWELPVMTSVCAADGHTTRQEMKELIADLKLRHSKVHGNLGAVVEAAARVWPVAGDA